MQAAIERPLDNALFGHLIARDMEELFHFAMNCPRGTVEPLGIKIALDFFEHRVGTLAD